MCLLGYFDLNVLFYVSGDSNTKTFFFKHKRKLTDKNTSTQLLPQARPGEEIIVKKILASYSLNQLREKFQIQIDVTYKLDRR